MPKPFAVGEFKTEEAAKAVYNRFAEEFERIVSACGLIDAVCVVRLRIRQPDGSEPSIYQIVSTGDQEISRLMLMETGLAQMVSTYGWLSGKRTGRKLNLAVQPEEQAEGEVGEPHGL